MRDEWSLPIEDAETITPVDGSFTYQVSLDKVRVVQQTWLEIPIDSTWVTAIRLIPQDGEPVVAEVRVFPNEGSKKKKKKKKLGQWSAERVNELKLKVPLGGLTARKLREVKLGDASKVVTELIDGWKRLYGSEIAPLAKRIGWTDIATELTKPDQAREPRSDHWYASIAALQLDAIAAGSKHPNPDVADFLSAKWEEPVTARRVRDLMNEARKRGLAVGPGQGRTGGALTAKGQRALKVKTL